MCFILAFYVVRSGRGELGRTGARGSPGPADAGVLWPWGALGMQHARRGRGADATGYGAIWGRANWAERRAGGVRTRKRRVELEKDVH